MKDYRIPGTETIIEKNVDLIISVLALHMDEKYYEHPKRFNPDRFNADNSAGPEILYWHEVGKVTN